LKRFLVLPEIMRELNKIAWELDGTFTDYKNTLLLRQIIKKDEHTDFLMMETITAFQTITNMTSFSFSTPTSDYGAGKT